MREMYSIFCRNVSRQELHLRVSLFLNF